MCEREKTAENYSKAQRSKKVLSPTLNIVLAYSNQYRSP